ncbi:restriction endonuclease subunit S [Macrococcus armenti]|uniref:restriction endonuclease subunit S n=1 Tax=Macrococcus armenti TaxID=2875764 RepID=UPI001CCA4EFA|nr:restriction endonuclease subunit S [Macrococcus armenti]UBH22073.1 restriction endonuclease subunit S [Macrococcus armenti]
MNEKKKNVPKRRFKEFKNADAWEQRKFSNMITDIADGPFGSNLKNEHYTDKKEVRIIQLSNLSDLGWQEENKRYTTFEHSKKIKRCIVNYRELVMGKMMPAGMTILRPNEEKMYILSSDCVRIKLNNDLVENNFFLYTTKSDYFLNQVNNDSQGSTRVRTSISKIKKMEIFIPTIDEQKKISETFIDIDSNITLHQRKLDKYKAIKESYLQEMFPAEGQRKPKRRFSGFTDDWEQRELESFCNLITKQTGFDYSSTIKPSLVKNNSSDVYSFIQNKDFNGEKINFNTDFYIPKYIAKKFPKILLDRPALLVTISGKIGNVGLYTNDEKAFIGGAVGICKLNNEDEGKFILYSLQSQAGQKQFLISTKTSSHANITVEMIKKILISIPTKSEEIKLIVNQIEILSKTITLHQKKLDKLKKLKEALLEEMFV